MTRHFRIKTLGCKVNQYESQALRERLLAAGWEESVTSPDLVILNTCAVTARAEAKCRKLLRRFLSDFPRSRVYLTGCGISPASPGASRLRELVPPLRRVQRLPGSERGISWFRGHHRAFLKVQDGCDSFCSYCLIPYLRGAPRSRPPVEILAEAARLDRTGYREVVLTGIHLGRYEASPGYGLVELIEDLLGAGGKYRLRLSSLEPREVTPRLLALFRKAPRLCPHLHIPLQSGSDRILRAMNRGYTGREYLSVLAAIRGEVPGIALGTDIISGFPGEEQADAARTLEVVGRSAFSRAHVFPYSPRRGTRAAAWPRPPAAVATARARELEEVVAASSREFRRSRVGKTAHPLWETRGEDGFWRGTDERYLRIILKKGAARPGGVDPVRITGFRGDCCWGEPLAAGFSDKNEKKDEYVPRDQL